MANETDRVEVTIGAKIDEVVDAVDQVSKKFGDFAKDTSEKFEEVASAGVNLGVIVARLVQAWLSYEVVKNAIANTREMALATEKLSTQLGISQGEASQFAIAIDDVGASVSEVSGLMVRQNRNLAANEEKMNALGVVTRTAAGELLGQREILFNSISTLNEYKAGTDRNQASMVIFGGRVGDLTKVLKLNQEVLDAAKVKADALGLTMTQEGVDGAEGFRAALNDLNDVSSAFMKVIGEAVMPVLTDLANYFADFGPAAVQVFAVSFKGLVTIVDFLWVALKQLLEIVRQIVQTMGVFAATIVDVVANVFNPSVAVGKWRAGMQTIEAIQADTIARMDKNGADFKARNEARWGPGTATGAGKGSRTYTPPPSSTAGASAAGFDAEIARAKLGLQMVEEYLSQEVEAKRMTEQEKLGIVKQAAQQVYEFELEILQRKVALYKEGTKEYASAMAAVSNLQSQHVLDVLKLDGDISKAEARTNEERIALERQALNARIKLAEADVALRRQQLDQDVQLGTISAAERLRIEREMLIQLNQLRMAALEEERELVKNKPKELAQVNERIRQEEIKHGIELGKNTQDTTEALSKRWGNVVSTITSSFGTMIKGILLGTTTWRKALENVFTGLISAFTDMAIKMAAEWVMLEVKKTIATQTGVATRTAAEAAGTSEGMLMQAAAVVRSIMNYAAEAFAGVWAALSGIPIVGPAMAAAAAPTAMATVAGIAGSVASLDVGMWNVPHDMFARIHEGEAVVPKGFANEMRESGSIGRGKGRGDVNINAVDAKSVRRLFRNNGTALVSTLRRRLRDNG